MVSAQLYSQIEEKSYTLKEQAVNQVLLSILTRHVLHKCPQFIRKRQAISKWVHFCSLVAQKSRQSSFVDHSERQLQNLEILMEEKSELEKKVEVQNE